jgi:hypothetical protein
MKLSSLGKSASPPIDRRNRLAAKAYRPSVLTLREFYPYLKERQQLGLFSHNQTPVTIIPDHRCRVLTISALAIKGLTELSYCENGQNVWTGKELLNISIA